MAEIIRVDRLDLPEIAVFSQLNEVQLKRYYEPNGGIFIAESAMIINRALDAGCIPVSMLVEEKKIEGEAATLIERCCDVDIPVFTSGEEILSIITGYTLTRGMLCAMKRPLEKTPAQVCENARRIAVLENVMNPTNVGAIFRSAAALGVEAVLLTKSCADPLYRRALRVGMGTAFSIPYAVIEDDYTTLPGRLRELGFESVAMALRDDSMSIDDPVLKEKERLAIILGTEGEGLNDETIEDSDYTVKIPMYHGVDSLNVAAASAVAFWEFTKK